MTDREPLADRIAVRLAQHGLHHAAPLTPEWVDLFRSAARTVVEEVQGDLVDTHLTSRREGWRDGVSAALWVLREGAVDADAPGVPPATVKAAAEELVRLLGSTDGWERGERLARGEARR